MSRRGRRSGGGQRRTNEVGNVRDVNSDLEGSVLVSGDREGVVEVLGRLRINGEDPALPEILPDLKLVVGDGLRKEQDRSSVSKSHQRTERGGRTHPG